MSSLEINTTFIEDVFELQTTAFFDDRGMFLNIFRKNDHFWKQVWAKRDIKQINLSLTKETGAIRGMHFQMDRYSEAKIVRCLTGAVFDVAVDLRPDSKTYCKWHAAELTAENGKALLIPEGCAHGYQVLNSNSQLLYLHSGDWVKEAESGVRWNDPKLDIQWPLPASQMNERDLTFPLLP